MYNSLAPHFIFILPQKSRTASTLYHQNLSLRMPRREAQSSSEQMNDCYPMLQMGRWMLQSRSLTKATYQKADDKGANRKVGIRHGGRRAGGRDPGCTPGIGVREGPQGDQPLILGAPARGKQFLSSKRESRRAAPRLPRKPA